MAVAPLTDEQIKDRENLAKEINELARKRGLKLQPGLDFPKYRELPLEGSLAIKVLENLGGQYILQFIELTQAEKDEFTKKAKKEKS
jgi:hypothetical protein